MGKRVILVHGRSLKPNKAPLQRLWHQAIRLGLERDGHDHALAVWDRMSRSQKPLVYYGDISNTFLNNHNANRYPIGDEANREQVKGRKAALKKLQAYGTGDFTRSTYRSLPGISGFMENAANWLAGPTDLFGLSDGLIRTVAPDMEHYWSDERKFGSDVRATMIRPMRQAFDSGDDIAVVAHSLGTLVSYDTLWKFSRYGEYRGTLTRNNYNDTDRFHVKHFITLGSPLGNPTVQRMLKGASNEKDMRYPANIRAWTNFAAEDDFISHDGKLANDFKGMRTAGLVPDGFTDTRIYNLSVTTDRNGKSKSNPHHISGYLIHPEFAKTLAAFLVG